MRLPRRRLLRMAGAGLALSAGLARTVSAAPYVSPFTSLFSDPLAARGLGHRFLRSSDNARTAMQAFASEARSEMLALQTPIHDIVAARVKADFAAGRIVVQDGWVLAEGEVLACAALAAEA
jgi:hypothetical protein